MSLDSALGETLAAIEQAVSLLVAYDTSEGIDARGVRLEEGAADGLRGLSRDWLNTLGEHAVVSYEATAELSDREVFLIEDPATLADFQDLYQLAEQAAELPSLAVDEIDRRISLYAVVTGDTDRIALFKRSDPRIGYSGGRRFLAILEERLTRLEEPAFAFYTSFEFVLAPSWALIVNQSAFEKVFRDAGLVEQHIHEWTEGIAQHLPWADGAVEALTEVALRDSRVWRRLREIHRRGHLAAVTIDQVREYAGRMELEVDQLVENDQLLFDPEERFSILHLLNEDLFRGPLTNERFEAQRKAGAQ